MQAAVSDQYNSGRNQTELRYDLRMERQRGGDDFNELSQRLEEVRFNDAIEFLSLAASGRAANSNPSAEQFLLAADLIHRGLINGEFNFDSKGRVESVRCDEITLEGWKFLDTFQDEKSTEISRKKAWQFLPGTIAMIKGGKVSNQ